MEQLMDPVLRCHGCGEVVHGGEYVRWLERESGEPFGGDKTQYPLRAYTHLGHELAGYRIIGRSLVGEIPETSGQTGRPMTTG